MVGLCDDSMRCSYDKIYHSDGKIHKFLSQYDTVVHGDDTIEYRFGIII